MLELVIFVLTAKPPRASPKSPPPVPPRQSSSSRFSGDYGMATTNENLLSHAARSPSRPPTSASSSSFTPSYVTPPQSPSHNALSLAKFYPEPELDFSDQTLPVVTSKAGCCRNIIIERQPSGDFGFSIRRASVTVKVSKPLFDAETTRCIPSEYTYSVSSHFSLTCLILLKGGVQDSILFVEPTQGSSIPRDYGKDFLLPGDRLIAVNSVPVESKSRDDAINLIKSSLQTITLKV